MRIAERIEEPIGIAGDYCSFFNFRIIEMIVSKLGTTKDKANLKKYKKISVTMPDDMCMNVHQNLKQ